MARWKSGGRIGGRPHQRLDLDHTDTGEPFVSVMAPVVNWEALACITRSEHGWQMHRGST